MILSAHKVIIQLSTMSVMVVFLYKAVKFCISIVAKFRYLLRLLLKPNIYCFHISKDFDAVVKCICCQHYLSFFVNILTKGHGSQ